ncbi:MAG: helix-turn-helix transcriptional regulator [Gammaproteobacteria bacterium]|nr:helix-turn-helix transcriptional regulator [Gammaproteobacteria bacterium]
MAAVSAFGSELRRWRRERGKSQLEVSHISGYSQRHVSFLESGRSQPTRTTVITLAEALDVPVKDRNQLLHAAGFAPIYSHLPIDSTRLQHAVGALECVLDSHRPFPAILVDRGWDTHAANDSALALFQNFLATPLSLAADRPLNAMRLCLDPTGLRPFIRNWPEFVSSLVVRLRHELSVAGDDVALRGLVDEIECDSQYVAHRRNADAAAADPVATLCLERDGVRIDLFSLISSFGTPNDATLSELRVETFFPADDASRNALLSLTGDAARPPRVAPAFAAWRSAG